MGTKRPGAQAQQNPADHMKGLPTLYPERTRNSQRPRSRPLCLNPMKISTDPPALAGVPPGPASLERKLSGRPKFTPSSTEHLRSSCLTLKFQEYLALVWSQSGLWGNGVQKPKVGLYVTTRIVHWLHLVRISGGGITSLQVS